VTVGVQTIAGSFDADEPYARVFDEWIEQTYRVRTTADAGDARIGKRPICS
jgi:hypothetical protein